MGGKGGKGGKGAASEPSPSSSSDPVASAPSPLPCMEMDWSTVLSSKTKKGLGGGGKGAKDAQQASTAASPSSSSPLAGAGGANGQGGKAPKAKGSASVAYQGGGPKPLVLSMLHDAVRKFSPRFSPSSGQEAAEEGAGPLPGLATSMAHRLKKGQRHAGASAHSQEQEDADVSTLANP